MLFQANESHHVNQNGVFGTLRGEHLFDAISGHSAVILPKMWRQNAANWTVTPRNPREPQNDKQANYAVSSAREARRLDALVKHHTKD